MHARRVGLVARVTIRRADDPAVIVAELPYRDWRALGFDPSDEVVASIRRARIFAAGPGQAC